MKNIKRKSFLKMSGLVMMAPFANSLILHAANADLTSVSKDDIVGQLVIANDQQVKILLQSITKDNIFFFAQNRI